MKQNYTHQGYRDLQKGSSDSVQLGAFSRDFKIAFNWSGSQPGSADNSDKNKTIEQPLARIKTII